MSDRIVTTVLILLATAAPAFAQVRSLPEPATVSLFAVGVCGAYLAKRLIGRK